MICPHCKKVIKSGVTAKVKAQAEKWKHEGYSLREMEKLFFAQGVLVSFASLSRALSKSQEQERAK